MFHKKNLNQEKKEDFFLLLLLGLGLCHFINDTGQALIPALYPLIKKEFHLSFLRIGLITLACQLTGAILQPFVGLYTDKNYHPFAIALSASLAALGLILLGVASSFGAILVAASLIGMGASIFHPEAARITHMGAGSNYGLAQSIFQVGGQAGTAFGPLFVAWFVVTHGRGHILWFAGVAMIAILILVRVGLWYHQHQDLLDQKKEKHRASPQFHLKASWHLWGSLTILVVLVFSKYLYMTCLINFYTFFLIEKFHLSIKDAQYHLVFFLIAIALGILFGGHLGDRIGRKKIIWISILGAAPFTILLPYVSLPVMSLLSILAGLILSSAFSSIVVYAQELLPGKVGMISGLFFGLAFGTAGVGSFALGALADHTGVVFVMHLCAWLPLIGVLTVFLPNPHNAKVVHAAA